MDFQRARITEVNQHMKMTMETSDKVIYQNLTMYILLLKLKLIVLADFILLVSKHMALTRMCTVSFRP